MSLEADLFALLGPLCGNRVYPDLAPHDTARPYITWQQVGGLPVNPVDNSEPGLEQARVQVNVWADTRLGASTLIHAVQAALRPAPMRGVPVAAAVSRMDELNTERGAQQDFLIWAAIA